MPKPDNPIPRKNVEFITFDEKLIPCYKGYCKIKLDQLSKHLIVDPYDEGVKMVSASFAWNCSLEANILFFETPGDITNFALIFNNINIGKKVVDIITKNIDITNDDESAYSSIFIKKFFIQLITEMDNCQMLSKIVKNFIRFCNEEKKGIFKKILKEKNVERNLNLLINEESFNRGSLKRPQPTSDTTISNIDNNRIIILSDDETFEPVPPKRRRIAKKRLQYTHFKLSKYKFGNQILQKLSVFKDKSDETKCFLFNWREKKNCFECYRCRQQNRQRFQKKPVAKAIIKENLDGEKCVETDFHRCRMSKYRLWNRGERKKIYRPEYEIIKSVINGKTRQRLIIFESGNKELCYEYAFKPKKDVFDCCGCTELRKGTRAKIYFQNTPDEYLEIYSDYHICDLRPYNNRLTVVAEKILKKPNYEIQNIIFRGKKTKKLIIFDKNDKELCHELCFEKSRFICRRCIKRKKNVFAYLKNDIDGNEYLQLSPTPHICSLQLYQSEKDKQEIIIDASKFKLISSDSKKDTFKIYIFTDNENELCHEFVYASKVYHCIGCRKKDHQFMAKLCKNDNNGEYFIQIKSSQKHICKPQKFKTDNSKNAIEPSKVDKNFILYQNENGTKKMIVFPIDDTDKNDKNDKKYCYDYLLDRTIFRCNKCAKLKKHVSAKIKKNAKEEDILELGAAKHVCKKLEFSTIKKSIIKELNYNDIFSLSAKDKSQKSMIKFELRSNKKNVKDAVLIIFHPINKLLCYEFHLLQSVDRYRCINCEKLKIRVSAKLTIDKNGEKYVEMGEKEHICKPTKYEAEKAKFTNFIILHENDAIKVPKLIIYTSEAKTECYEYRKENLHFICNGCTGKKAYAKLLQDSDGNRYIDFCAQEHTCIPQIFDAKKYEDDAIIDSTKFEIFPNSLKEPNSKLFIFNSSNNQKFGYEYYKHKNNFEKFYCYQCHRYLNKGVSAKLLPKNDEINNFDVKISKAKHACEPQNFVETGHLYFPPNFIYQNATDINKEMIKVIYSKDKTLCYHFEFDSGLQIYYCISCSNRNRFISGKIVKCDEMECFFVGYDHKCFPMPI